MRKWILHNLGLKLLSVFLAIFLWVVVLGEQKVDVTLNVPLTLNIPTTLMLVNDLPESLEVHLRGPKTLVTSLVPREVTFSEPPGKLAEGENFIPIREDMVRVPRGIQVVDVVPHRIRVVLEALSEREIEVSPRVEGVPAAGFVVRRVISVPARVWMSGPTSEIRRLTQVRTLPVSLSGQMRSFSAQVLLEPVGPLIRIQDGAPIIVEVEIDAKRS
jgi:YbbR domain-containing protein